MFISPAFAQEAAAAAAGAAQSNPLTSMLPILLIIIVFYFMVIRPQSKRIQEHRNIISNLKKGDKVVTGGGLIAKVVKMVGDDEIVLEIADGVEVKAMRSTIVTTRSAAETNKR